MKKAIIFTMGVLMFLVGGATAVEANLSYGSGYYTNLCDSGTSAKYYSCDPGCNPTLGSCQSGGSGVVKWVCSGKWNQCLESESGWDGYEDVSGIACGTTVQLSLFDKKCRREDGGWDNSCKLLGYMVWYSGDCTPGYQKVPVSTRAVTSTPKPTGVVLSSTSIPTPTPRATVVPTSVSKLGSILSPTPRITATTAVQIVCGKTCNDSTVCQAGFVCASGVCRNPACVNDAGCFCGQVAGAVAGKSPDTGVSSWWGALVLLGAGAAGVQMRKLAKKLW